MTMAKQQIAIIDYGMGNLHSASKAIEAVSEHKVVITQDPKVLKASDKIVFPGVGAIKACMAGLQAQGLDELIPELIKTKPMLGICIAMQALCRFSEENDGVECLNVFDADVRFFGEGLVDENTQESLKVPHMGWNTVHHQAAEHPIWKGIESGSHFYFVHSYYAEANLSETIGETEYGNPFSAVLAKDNVVATQFHPEKSAQEGLRLLKNFCAWNGQA